MSPADRQDSLQEQNTSRWLIRLAVLIWLIAAGACLAHVSLTMHPRFHTYDDAVGSQLAILDRTPAHFAGTPDDISNWRNRVMIPYAIEGISKLTHMGFGHAYTLMRWITASAALLLYSWMLERLLRLTPLAAALSATMFAFCLIPTFTHIYEIPSDFLDAGSFAVLTVLALEGRRTIFTIVLFVALLNRESAVFALFVWFALFGLNRGPRGFIREAAWCSVLGILAALGVFGLRTANAGIAQAHFSQGVQTFTPFLFWSVNYQKLLAFLHAPHFGDPYVFLAGILAFLALFTAAEWKALQPSARRLMEAAAFIFLLSIISNNLDELRIFIPSLVLVTLVLVSVACQRPLEAAVLS